ncbi:Plasmodium exported protein (Pm-fam-a like), unknown function [Plasmodium malariae]|uniref:Fam-l protein n=1 Tax=Plasmodium malariae TaxID=5858 RepID=A0A1A8WHB3_PLAMA|nr:Plasmodium exported protein (Pm-fam-a like), unknown function [Plasmodium malariae]
MGTTGGSFYEKNFDKKLDTKTYRSLAKYEVDTGSFSIRLNKEIQNNERSKEKDLYNNEKVDIGRKHHSKKSLTKNAKGHKLSKNNKSSIFETKKYSRLEKKIFKELDYEDFLKKNKMISNNTYKKIICKKYGLKIALPLLLFLFLLTVLIVDFVIGWLSDGKGGFWYQLELWEPLEKLAKVEGGWLYKSLEWIRSKLPESFTNCAKWVSTGASQGGSHTCNEVLLSPFDNNQKKNMIRLFFGNLYILSFFN